ncbi:DUF4149 domain-containing protein [Nitrosophilus alvini]|uniref:DUF4149 domain-containing protein n=1 Tax=Nitrosophilus alvini TaxID=2714855 RepID=UPI00190C65AA|nr:DUF4149 domain-containing protein [Nitrosophilus alvini]
MKRNKYIDIAYIIIIGITLGAVLATGIFVAPVVFNSAKYLGEEILSHYQEGLLMTAIFLKMNYLLNFTAFLIIIREAYAFKLFERDRITVAAAITSVFAIFMFTLYYTPDIVAMQMAGEEMTGSETFDKVHKASEIDFKLLALSLAVLMGRRIINLNRR